MSNTITAGLEAALAQRIVAGLKHSFGNFSVWSTNFSDEVMNVGANTVTIPYATQGTGSTLANSDVTGFTRSDSTLSAITITPDYVYYDPTLNEAEEMRMGMTDDYFVQLAVDAVASKCFALCMATISAASFTAAVCTAASFGYDDIVDLNVTLDGNGALPQRAAILNPTLAGALKKDTNISKGLEYGSSSVIQSGKFLQVGGVDIATPTNVTGIGYCETPTSAVQKNCLGLIGAKNALNIFARAIPVPVGFMGTVGSYTDPDTGLTIQTRKWWQNGVNHRWAGLYFGCGAGSASAALKLYVN